MIRTFKGDPVSRVSLLNIPEQRATVYVGGFPVIRPLRDLVEETPGELRKIADAIIEQEANEELDHNNQTSISVTRTREAASLPEVAEPLLLSEKQITEQESSLSEEKEVKKERKPRTPSIADPELAAMNEIAKLHEKYYAKLVELDEKHSLAVSEIIGQLNESVKSRVAEWMKAKYEAK